MKNPLGLISFQTALIPLKVIFALMVGIVSWYTTDVSVFCVKLNADTAVLCDHKILLPATD